MPDAVRVLVTGSRQFSSPETIRAALVTIQGEHPAAHMILVHGRCDPRAIKGHRIGWDAAVLMSEDAQMALWGADWLADRIATSLGWGIEAYPADWRTHPRSAGMIRNGKMVTAAPGMALAFFAGGQSNRGTLDCAGKAVAAGIATLCYCDMCASPRLHPCRNHSLEADVLAWQAAARRGAKRKVAPGGKLW